MGFIHGDYGVRAWLACCEVVAAHEDQVLVWEAVVTSANARTPISVLDKRAEAFVSAIKLGSSVKEALRILSGEREL